MLRRPEERRGSVPADRLRANGHSRIVAVCLSAGLGLRTPVLLADRMAPCLCGHRWGSGWAIRCRRPGALQRRGRRRIGRTRGHGWRGRAAVCGSGSRCRARFPWCCWRLPPITFTGTTLARPRRRWGQLLGWRRGLIPVMPDDKTRGGPTRLAGAAGARSAMTENFRAWCDAEERAVGAQ